MSPLAGMVSLPSIRRTSAGASIPSTIRRRVAASASGPRPLLRATKYGRKPGALAVSRGEARVTAQLVGIGRKEIRGDREPAGQELPLDLLGRDAEPEDEALRLRESSRQ